MTEGENLPEDPNDPYYLTNCYVCKDVAKPFEEFIRNYGGLVCFSCRAFFRRAIQVLCHHFNFASFKLFVFPYNRGFNAKFCMFRFLTIFLALKTKNT
jgi:hypothetical protein